MPDEGAVRNVTIDAAGRIWLAGLGEVALLEPDARGRLTAVSKTALLPPDRRRFGNLTQQFAGPDGVYFSSGRTLVHFDPDRARSWHLPASVGGIWHQQDRIHVVCGAAGIHRLEADGEFHPVRGPDAATSPTRGLSYSIFAVRAQPDGALLLTGRGPMRWRGEGTALEPLSAAASALFREQIATTATFLPDGSLAFGFLLHGIRIFSPDGKLIRELDTAHGLPSNRIEELAADYDGGLWIAQRSGLVRLQLDGRYAFHGIAQGLPGSPRSLLRHRDRLYVAHNEGVAWRDEATGRFHSVEGLTTGLTMIFPGADRLFGPGRTLYEVLPDDRARSVLPVFALSVVPVSRAPGFFLAGNTTEVRLLHFDGRDWSDRGRLARVTEGVTRLVDAGDGTFWGAAYNGRALWRIDLRGVPGPDAPAERFGMEHGIPAARRRDSPRVVLLDGDVVATSASWTRRFDPLARRFVPDTPLRGLEPDTGALSAARPADGVAWWFLPRPTESLAALRRTAPGSWQLDRLPGGELRDLVPNGMYHDDAARTLWIAGQGGLVSADLAWQPLSSRPPLRALVRTLRAGTDEPWFVGPGTPRRLPADRNAVQFTFAAPTFATDWRGRSGTEFRTRLDGLDSDWTPWSARPFRDFTNLPYRELALRVQARDLDGRVGAETVFAFAVSPPWWLARAALVGYGVSGLGAVAGIIYLRTRALRRRNRELEAVVAARTAELERLRQIDRDESAAARLAAEKARLETLRYQLNPHFLYNALNSIRALAYSDPPAAGEMVTQLADFCRLTLARPEEFTTVREEFALLELYLAMEKTRWREKLAVVLDLDPTAADCPLPPFLLLPLVENALKHGRQSVAGILHFRLSARRPDHATLRLEVTNSGRWLAAGESTAPSTGIGLENLRQRLHRYFSGRAEVLVATTADTVTVALQLPLDGRDLPVAPRATAT